MKVPVEWVNSYLPKELSTREMADAMELAAIEVEGVQEVGLLDPNIVVGKVDAINPHPNADRLRVATIDVGSRLLHIVCGASNLAKGQLVPVAMLGAVMPDGTKIKRSNIRGEDSEGMICSGHELGVSDDRSGIMVIERAVIGQKIAEVFTTKAVIDVKTSANRWDLTSILGISREVAAQVSQKIKFKRRELDFGSGNKPKIKSNLNTSLVNIYMLAPLSVSVNKPSPQWMRERLINSGVRPINVVVDITNYVMLEYGQPLHAFDAGMVTSEVEVRLARTGENLITLDGLERKLENSDVVIADSRSVLGLAGVMGGEHSEVSAKTADILLEAASFNPALIRKTAIRYGLRSEASARFERGVPAHPQDAMAAAIQLLVEHADAKLSGTISTWQNLDTTAVQTAISIDPKRIGKLLGMEISGADVASQLSKLDFIVDGESATGSLSVTVPWWRPDVRHEADIAEEVIKLIGYHKLDATLPAWKANGVRFDKKWSYLWRAKGILRSLDLFEVATYSFISERQITDLGWDSKDFYALENPKSVEQAFLRKDLLPSLIATAARNRKYHKQFGMFEVSKGFNMAKEGLPNENLSLGVLTFAPEGAYKWVKSALDRLGREFNIKLKVESKLSDHAIWYPNRLGVITIEGKEVGYIGQLHPNLARSNKLEGEIAYMEINPNLLFDAAKPVKYKIPSPYPTIKRDISLVLNRNITWQEVSDTLSKFEVSFVGDYYGKDLPEGKKSLTIRVTIIRFDRTPTEVDADKEELALLGVLNKKFNVTLRH